MRKYKKIAVVKNKIDKVVCNCCGAPIDPYADCLRVDKVWGYGTAFDGEKHSFDLCEGCYKRLVSDFKISVDSEEKG